MTVSVCHTTARQDGWEASYHSWRKNTAGTASVQYVLCMDARWGFTKEDAWIATHILGVNFVVWNEGRKCMVDGYAAAVAAATGDLLILNSDDVFPPAKWDTKLFLAIAGKPNVHPD